EGVEFLPTSPVRPLPVRVYRKIIEKLRLALRLPPYTGRPAFSLSNEALTFQKYLKKYQPKMVLVSQGVNFDGLGYAYGCMELNIPYTIVSHNAVDFYWPPAPHRNEMRNVMLGARRCFFVSQHNKRLTEEQFGVRLANSEVIFNPVNPTAY